MWRPMRRSGQQLPDKETETILACGREGVLAVTDSEGWPYAVPVNYCWKDGKIIIHSAREGHKIDAVRENDKVSFCVVAEKAVIPENTPPPTRASSSSAGPASSKTRRP